MVVDTDKETEVRLILNGVDITCSDSAPINSRLAGKITITLAEGAENGLTASDDGLDAADPCGDIGPKYNCRDLFGRTNRGTEVLLKDSEGKVLASYAPEKEYSGIQISVEGIEEGKTYLLYSGNVQLSEIMVSGTVTIVDETGAEVNTGGGGRGGSDGKEGPDGIGSPGRR